MVTRLLTVAGLIVTMLAMSPDVASATGCVQVNYGPAGPTPGHCGQVASAAVITAEIAAAIAIGYALARAQRASRGLPSLPSIEISLPQPGPSDIPGPPRRPSPRTHKVPDEIHQSQAGIQQATERPARVGKIVRGVIGYGKTMEKNTFAMVPEKDLLKLADPNDSVTAAVIGFGVIATWASQRLGQMVRHSLSWYNANHGHGARTTASATGEQGARALIRDLLSGADAEQYIRNCSDQELVDVAALASMVSGVLVARGFAAPQDVRIKPFVDNMTRSGTTGIAPHVVDASIRCMLGDQAQLRVIPPEQITVAQLLISRAIITEHGATPRQVEALLDIAEPLARSVARSPSVS